MDAKVIALFNHKGGVSKTTTTFNLGWKLAELGLKTLIVDADPQCNLTASVLGLEEDSDLLSWYNSKDNDDIYSKIRPIVEGDNTIPQPIKAAVTIHPKLFLIAGNIQLSELDINMAIGLATNEYNKFAEQFVGAFNACIRKTADEGKFDIVLIDMSPSISAMNRCILMGADYFIVPTSPDFFCYQAIQSLSTLLPKIAYQFNKFRERSIKNRLPENPPKFLGIISQKFRKYETESNKNTTTKAYQYWIDKIQQASLKKLAPALKKNNLNMLIDESHFRSHALEAEYPYNLISISDFNTLIARAQQYNKPIYVLNDKELGTQGAVKTNDQENQKRFDKCFTDLAILVCNLIGIKIADKEKFDTLLNNAIK